MKLILLFYAPTTSSTHTEIFKVTITRDRRMRSHEQGKRPTRFELHSKAVVQICTNIFLQKWLMQQFFGASWAQIRADTREDHVGVV